jgi:hypothetical protein
MGDALGRVIRAWSPNRVPAKAPPAIHMPMCKKYIDVSGLKDFLEKKYFAHC